MSEGLEVFEMQKHGLCEEDNISRVGGEGKEAKRELWLGDHTWRRQKGRAVEGGKTKIT